MNEYPDNLCHLDRSTGTTYAFSNRRNIYRDFEILQCSLEFFQIALEVQMESNQNPNARRSPAANILTTNSTIPFFCRLLWTQILNL
jgi:hypothetical protein